MKMKSLILTTTLMGAIDKSLKIKDPNAVQMMDITIGTANKQQF